MHPAPQSASEEAELARGQSESVADHAERSDRACRRCRTRPLRAGRGNDSELRQRMRRHTSRRRTTSAASTPRRTKRCSSWSPLMSDWRSWIGAAPAIPWCCSPAQGTTPTFTMNSLTSSLIGSASSASRGGASDARASPLAGMTSTRERATTSRSSTNSAFARPYS